MTQGNSSGENKLKQLDELIRSNHSKRLLRCGKNDLKQIQAIEKDFCDDLQHYGLELHESKEIFKRLKKSHLG